MAGQADHPGRRLNVRGDTEQLDRALANLLPTRSNSPPAASRCGSARQPRPWRSPGSAGAAFPRRGSHAPPPGVLPGRSRRPPGRPAAPAFGDEVEGDRECPSGAVSLDSQMASAGLPSAGQDLAIVLPWYRKVHSTERHRSSKLGTRAINVREGNGGTSCRGLVPGVIAGDGVEG